MPTFLHKDGLSISTQQRLALWVKRGTKSKPNLLMNNSARPIFMVAASFCCLLTGAFAQAQETQPAPTDAAQPTQAPSSGVLPLPSQTSPASGVQLPKPKKRRAPLFGPQIEFSQFLSSKTRSRFRPDTMRLNFGFGDPTPTLKGKILPDISVVYARNMVDGDKNRLFVISLGPEFRQAYVPSKIRRLIKQLQAYQAGGAQARGASGTPPTSNGPTPPGFPPPGFPPGGFPTGGPPIAPYYGVGANLLYASIKSPLENINGSGFGVGGSVFAGVVFRRRFTLEARVRATTSVRGYNFSRAGLNLGVRF